MRVLAELLEPVEAETPYGGQVTSYHPLGSAWLRVVRQSRRDRTEAGATSGIEAATAETRLDPRLIEGRVIRFGGGDWTLMAVSGEPDRPGRVTLKIERTRGADMKRRCRRR